MCQPRSLTVRTFRDPESISSPEGGFQEAAKALLRPLKARIAWTSNLGGISPVHPEVEATCYTAVQWLESQGAELANAYPDLSDSEHIFQVSMSSLPPCA